MDAKWIFPGVAITQVTGRSAQPWGVYVIYPSIQASGVLVSAGLNGSADALRVSQKALPTEGTWGIVVWPYGDSRGGVWICSVYTQGYSAIVNTNADIDYEAHPSGAWDYLDQNGNYTFALPDGSFVQFGNGGAKPELTRQVVDSTQHIVTIPYPDSTRQATAPPPFPMTLSLASGTAVFVDAAGNVTMQIAGNATIQVEGTTNITSVGNATIQVDGATNITSVGNATIQVDGATNITSAGTVAVTTPTMILNGDLQVNGNIGLTGTITPT